MTTNTLGSEPAFRPKPATAWLLPFAPMGFAAFSLSALVFFHLRQDAFEVQSSLQHVYAALYRAIGFAPAVMFFGLVILWSTIWLVNGALNRPLQRLGRLAAMTVMLGVLLNLGDGGVSPALHKGELGAAVAQVLVSSINYWPSLVLVWVVTFASLLLATDFFFQECFERLFANPPDDAAGERDVSVETLASKRLREVDAAAEPAAAATPLATKAEPPRRRHSYDERRAEREAMASRWSAAAVAPAAEPSAMDPFELSAARVVDAIDATTGATAEAVESDVVDALQRGMSDDGYASARSRAQRAPIVFPDEVPVAESASDAADDGGDGLVAEPTADAGGDRVTDDALGLGDEVIVLADPNDPGFAASDGAVLDGDEAAADEDAPTTAAADVAAVDTSTPAPTASDEADVVIPRPEPTPDRAELDEGLIAEAIELVTSSRRANAVFLQRKLRVDYQVAAALLAELAARSVVALDAEATHGRVLG
ncbi:MAG: hypothetical protein FJ301_04285 [Planctomycetes bacterium]|nr:hypothetical protein [Planctomycetota bacterium]